MNFATSQYRYSCVSLIVAVTAAAVLNATPSAAQTLGGGDLSGLPKFLPQFEMKLVD